MAENAGWRSLNEGLPETATIQCMVADNSGNLFAGAAGDGVLCWRTDSAVWRRQDSGRPQLDVRCLAVDPTGGLLAGTANGGIFRSTDRGAIWTELTGRTLGRARWTLARRSKKLDHLPETPARSLLAVGQGARWSLLAGTDSGVYLSTDLANSWTPRNRGLPAVDSKTGETSLVISALVQGSGDSEIYAGTANGVFKSTDLGRNWQSANRGLPGTEITTGLTGEEIRALVFLATSGNAAITSLPAPPRGCSIPPTAARAGRAPARGWAARAFRRSPP